MKVPKPSQYQYAKTRYRIGNWPEYEAALRQRGDFTVWLSDAALDAWRAPASGKPGGQRTYADMAIEAALTIHMVFHLPLRQTEGFLRSLAQLLELGLRIHVGALRKPPKRRAWRNLHLAVDAATGEIVASDLTSRRTRDGARVSTLLEQIDNPVAALSSDGAYDQTGVYEAAQEKGEGRRVRVLIPPGRNARLNPSPSPAQRERNRNILSIRELGRREWHKSSGYSGRAMVENAVFRYKTIMGRRMRSRTFDGQRVEVQLASKILNRTTRLGMPESYRVA